MYEFTEMQFIHIQNLVSFCSSSKEFFLNSDNSDEFSDEEILVFAKKLIDYFLLPRYICL